jgi:hypothetical protein
MEQSPENSSDLDIALGKICNLFGNPSHWSTGQRKTSLPGSGRPHVFHIFQSTELANITTALEVAKIRSVVIIGINPIAFSIGFALKQLQFKVSLVASGQETPNVIERLHTSEVASFLECHGIIVHPCPAKSLRGSQVHCQSGYCGFVCEGRFIKESDEVGCIVTERGNVYADAVIIVEAE